MPSMNAKQFTGLQLPTGWDAKGLLAPRRGTHSPLDDPTALAGASEAQQIRANSC
jgi:hypothetical protein